MSHYSYHSCAMSNARHNSLVGRIDDELLLSGELVLQVDYLCYFYVHISILCLQCVFGVKNNNGKIHMVLILSHAGMSYVWVSQWYGFEQFCAV